jgi:hypothetical protein
LINGHGFRGNELTWILALVFKDLDRGKFKDWIGFEKQGLIRFFVDWMDGFSWIGWMAFHGLDGWLFTDWMDGFHGLDRWFSRMGSIFFTDDWMVMKVFF